MHVLGEVLVNFSDWLRIHFVLGSGYVSGSDFWSIPGPVEGTFFDRLDQVLDQRHSNAS